MQPLAASVSYTSVLLTCQYSRMLKWRSKMFEVRISCIFYSFLRRLVPHYCAQHAMVNTHVFLYKLGMSLCCQSCWLSPSSHEC